MTKHMSRKRVPQRPLEPPDGPQQPPDMSAPSGTIRIKGIANHVKS
jgi:hypothetical protein